MLPLKPPCQQTWGRRPRCALSAEGLTRPLLGGICFSVSHYYGYGLLDAGLLVEMAKAWTGTQPQQKCSVKALHIPR